MDIESRKQWQLDHPVTDLLTWGELAKILGTRSWALESGPIPSRSIQNTTNQLPWKVKRKQSYSVVTCSDCDSILIVDSINYMSRIQENVY